MGLKKQNDKRYQSFFFFSTAMQRPHPFSSSRVYPRSNNRVAHAAMTLAERSRPPHFHGFKPTTKWLMQGHLIESFFFAMSLYIDSILFPLGMPQELSHAWSLTLHFALKRKGSETERSVLYDFEVETLTRPRT